MEYVFKKKARRLLFAVIDALGSVLFIFTRLTRRKIPATAQNILVIRLDHIGDVVYATGVAKNLKSHFKDAKVTYLVAGWAKELLVYNSDIDEIICFDAPWFSRDRNNLFSAIKSFFKLSGLLRQKRFDIGIDLRGDFRNIVLMKASGVKFSVGFGVTGGGFLLNKKVPYRKNAHPLERNFDILKGLGAGRVFRGVDLPYSANEERSVENLFAFFGISKGDQLVIIHPIAGIRSKNWPSARFEELIRQLSAQLHNKAKIILLGSSNDNDKVGKMISNSGISAINAAGKISLLELSVLFKRSYFFVGVDSGPSHIAAASGLPAVILYSGTNIAEEWAPLSEKVELIEKDVPCKGCEKEYCPRPDCMELISVEEVMERIKKAVSVCV